MAILDCDCLFFSTCPDTFTHKNAVFPNLLLHEALSVDSSVQLFFSSLNSDWLLSMALCMVGWIMAPWKTSTSKFLELKNATLYAKIDFTDMNKFKPLRWGVSWIIQVSSKYNHRFAYMREKFDTEEQENAMGPQRDRLEWGGFKPRNVTSPRGRGKGQILSRTSKGSVVLSAPQFQWYWYWTSGLHTCERINSCCF